MIEVIEVDVVTCWKMGVVLAEKSMRYEMQKRRDPAQEEKKDSSESTKTKKRNKSWKEKQSDERKTNERCPHSYTSHLFQLWFMKGET